MAAPVRIQDKTHRPRQERRSNQTLASPSASRSGDPTHRPLAAMALRSLVVKLKALPLRVPGSGSFARAPKPKPKDDPWAKVLAEFENPSKYGSMEEFSRALGPLLEKEFKPIQEKHQKQICFFRGLGLLLSASLGYTISTIAKG